MSGMNFSPHVEAAIALLHQAQIEDEQIIKRAHIISELIDAAIAILEKGDAADKEKTNGTP